MCGKSSEPVLSCVLISHLLGEILDFSDRIVVMRDGLVVAADRASAFNRDKLVARDGRCRCGQGAIDGGRLPCRAGRRRSAFRAHPAAQSDGIEFVAHAGEIVGLAGLSGHGQTGLLLLIFKARHDESLISK